MAEKISRDPNFSKKKFRRNFSKKIFSEKMNLKKCKKFTIAKTSSNLQEKTSSQDQSAIGC
jgi:hypothetical protein